MNGQWNLIEIDSVCRTYSKDLWLDIMDESILLNTSHSSIELEIYLMSIERIECHLITIFSSFNARYPGCRLNVFSTLRPQL